MSFGGTSDGWGSTPTPTTPAPTTTASHPKRKNLQRRFSDFTITQQDKEHLATIQKIHNLRETHIISHRWKDLEGYIQKKSSKGKFQTRYFVGASVVTAVPPRKTPLFDRRQPRKIDIFYFFFFIFFSSSSSSFSFSFSFSSSSSVSSLTIL